VKNPKGEDINILNRPYLPSIHINQNCVLEFSVSTARRTKHRAINCTKVTGLHERQSILSKKKTVL